MNNDDFKQWLESLNHYSPSTIRAVLCDFKTIENKYSKLSNYPDLSNQLSEARIKSCCHAYDLYCEYAEKGHDKRPSFERPILSTHKRKTKRQRRQKDAVSIDITEWLRIGEELDKNDTIAGIVLYILTATGLRIGDVLRLEKQELVNAFSRKDGLLRIVVKGQKPVYSTVRGPVEHKWKSLLSAFQAAKKKNVAELVSPSGNGDWRPAGSAYQMVRRTWKTLCERLDIHGEHNLHRIRRTVAVLIQKNAGIQYAQKVLGHESEKTTRLYVDETQADTIRVGLEKLAALRK